MKTLCVSDLDGTLLNPSVELDEYTLNAVTRYISHGGIFTVATARTSETVRHIMSGARLNAPQILMNGVFAFDMRLGRFVMSRFIDTDSTKQLIETVDRFGLSGFLYLGGNDRVSTFYTRLDTEQSRLFKSEREEKFRKVFTYTDSFKSLELERTVYFSVCEKKEVLDEAAAELKKIDGLNVIYHSDVYDTGLWYLDICSKEASKRTALQFLRNEYKFDSVTAFGDNYNDLPMFEEADTKVAVSNAVDAVKNAADIITESNLEDGVARCLLKSI